jgi:arylsulfatase A-like enzyme
MIARTIGFWTCVACLAVLGPGAQADESGKPNLLVIHTDEHNFRTLGCYREQLPEAQAFIWGKGVKVDTPHLDSLAHEGAICTHFYAASPVCTPSRASFVTGLYPQATGSPSNNMPMKDDLITFAEVLQRNGYATAYVGKWHLDGNAKPGFAPRRKFGFTDNRFMFNRGHWKVFKNSKDGSQADGSFDPKVGYYSYNIAGANVKTFATDFLTDRTLEILQRDKGKPFCVMLSIPDPHGPNTVRSPYDTMFRKLLFQKPRSMSAILAKPATAPKWNLQGKNTVKRVNQAQMARYFGMVKCIDDNVGRILKYLKDNGLDKNTIVVFTSDHGDLMCEHCRLNKGLPYETSAGIPFLVRYPDKIKPGKVIRTAYTNVDFTPTILGLMGFEKQIPTCHGQNASADFLKPDKIVDDDRIVYFRQASGRWVAAVDHRYKLVLSANDKPWLFDLEKDPDELTNFYEDPLYREIAVRLKEKLVTLMKQYNEPALMKLNYD